MNLPVRPKVVVLGMMTKMPVGGVVWQNVHYLVGLERLGCEVWYVEAHARTPSMFVAHEGEDGSEKAAAFIDGVMRRFGLAGRWAFQALHGDGRCFGLSDTQLARLYAEADIIINLHGGTIPQHEHAATGRLVYLETDPVQLQIELHDQLQTTIDFLDPHVAFFTFGENIGSADCGLPVSEFFTFQPTRQPVVMDFWNPAATGPGTAFTSIGNWEQQWREVWFRGERYSWSKHHEFLKFIDLPRQTAQRLELALASYSEETRALLTGHGWHVRSAMDFSADADAYRAFIAGSRGEFTVAKDQNVRLRSGWFSDRSATYLAAGRPVITQDTGFGNILPTGAGLFAFQTMDDVLRALDAINGGYARHARAAEEIARGYFDHEVVLRPLLAAVGVAVRAPRRRSPAPVRLPAELLLTPLSRRPLQLPPATVQAALATGVPRAHFTRDPALWRVSVVVVTFNNLAFTKLCLASLLLNTSYANYEVVLVDNASTDGTPEYLRAVVEQNPHVRVLENARNTGFAAASNQGLAAAQGDVLVLLNNDTIVAPTWLGLLEHLADPGVGLLGPVTNRIGNEAEVETDYRTYGGFLKAAAQRRETERGARTPLGMAAMFCLAFRRDVFTRLGPLDETFGSGLFEDDDYAMRAHAAGLGVFCAEDVLVHHFGEASFGDLAPSGDYARLFEANRRRFEEKWGVSWQPPQRRDSVVYRELSDRLRALVEARVPAGAVVLVVGKGDDALLEFTDRTGWHFPRAEDGGYAGHHPADSAAAIAHLEALRTRGATFFVLPAPSAWWLDHYAAFAAHLRQHYRETFAEEYPGRIFDLH